MKKMKKARFANALNRKKRKVITMTSDEIAVFECITNCVTSSYTTLYSSERVVVSTKEIARMCLWSKCRTKKAIKSLVDQGLIERASCGNPAIIFYGECPEIIYNAMPPKNGYAITKIGFQSDIWKNIYGMWCKSMEELRNM